MSDIGPVAPSCHEDSYYGYMLINACTADTILAMPNVNIQIGSQIYPLMPNQYLDSSLPKKDTCMFEFFAHGKN